MRREQYRRIHSFVAQRGGVNHLPSIFDSAEVAFRDKVSSQQIPTNVSFELTYGCNEKCIHCYNPLSPRSEVGVKKVATNELKKEDYFKILDDLTEMGVPQVLFTGGDPFVKKDFLEILNYAHQKKFAISIYSNGQSLSSNENLYQSVIDTYPYKIGLSIYSMKANEHEAITRVPGSLAKTKAIARRLHKDGVSLQIKCPIMKLNQEGYRKVNAFAEEVCGSPEFEVNITGSVDGDNYAVNNLRLSEAEMEVILIDPLMPLSTNREDTQRAMERTPEMQFCGAGIDAVNITPTGDIYPCMAFPLKCGNVREQSIRDIWEHSPELKATRELTYGMSDRCGKESYCKFCNRCIGQSFIEHGNPANASTDNCFIAQLRERIFKDKPVS